METFTYKINKTETTNWQEAIDLFKDTEGWTAFCPVMVTNSSGVILMYLNDFEDIQGWSERLMNTRLNEEDKFDEYGNYGENNGPLPEFKPKNRVEGRIMQEHSGMEVVKPQESHEGFMTRSHKLAKDIELPLTEDLSDTATELEFHGNFSEMDKWTQEQIINPKHYKMIPKEAYVNKPGGLEYMDLMEYILEGHEGVEAHLLGQVFKYACRLGKKDSKLQDAKKIAWYANRLVTVIEYPVEKD